MPGNYCCLDTARAQHESHPVRVPYTAAVLVLTLHIICVTPLIYFAWVIFSQNVSAS